MSNPVREAIVAYLQQNPNADNEAVAAYVRKAVPGSQTTAASVSSVKSRLKKDDPSVLPQRQVEAHDGAFKTPDSLPDHDPSETLDEAKQRIAIRYDALDRMAARIAKRKVPSLIVSGPPGLGKSFSIRKALATEFPEGEDKTLEDTKDEDSMQDEGLEIEGQKNYDIISGSVSAVGLYQALWYCRNGGILVLDDCDDVFRDETALNLLKAALDSSPVRTISWRKEAKWLEEYGIADRFAFKGCVVFLTNIDFEQVIQSGKRDAEHFKALIDRSMYLCLTLRSRRDFMIRIRQVSEGPQGMLADQFGLTEEQSEEVLDFVAQHQTRFYNLSLRLVGQVAICMLADSERWQEDVEATKMRTM